MPRYFVVAAVLLAIASPALAAEFFLVKDPATGKCAVLNQKPDGTKLIMVGTETYPTKAEGKAAKKAAVECKKDKASKPS